MKQNKLIIITLFASINILGLGIIYFKINKQNDENKIYSYNSPYSEKNDSINDKNPKNMDNKSNLSKD